MDQEQPIIGEIFNQRRMNRCTAIARRIINHWIGSKRVDYVLRTNEPVDGKSLAELQTMYFTVGTPGHSEDVSFVDMLVIFRCVAAHHKLLQEHQGAFTADYNVGTEFTADEASAILRGLHFDIVKDKSTGTQKPEDQTEQEDQTE